jgi:hypothetical protein
MNLGFGRTHRMEARPIARPGSTYKGQQTPLRSGWDQNAKSQCSSNARSDRTANGSGIKETLIQFVVFRVITAMQ